MLKIWHRWASGYELENTLASFIKAIDLWVDMIELDVRICASWELIVSHDDDLYRLLNVEQDIYTASLNEIQQHRFHNNEYIITLRDALDLIDKRSKVNIEVKHISASVELVNLLSDYVNNKWRNWDHFIISSFDQYAIRMVKDLEPKACIWALVEWIIIWYAEFAEKLWCYSIHLNIDYINQEFVNDSHARWIKVYTYTCNTKIQIKRAYDLWVDGIISDYPDKI